MSKSQERATEERTWLNNENVLEIYTDSANLAATFYGFVLEFGLARRGESLGQLVARVRMSPELAKTFAIMLVHAINQHEQQNGYKIPVPPDILAQITPQSLAIAVQEDEDTLPGEGKN